MSDHNPLPEPLDIGRMLDQPPPTDIEIAASLARTAADILERHGEDRVDSATWRLADALALVALHARGSEMAGELPGVDEPTGRGAWLRPGYHE